MAKVFSVLDARNGFWQVKLDTDSSYLTTLNTPFGRFRSLRLPFGVKTAPEEYQCRIHESLCVGEGDTYECAVQDHDKNLIALLESCREKNIKLNPKKYRTLATCYLQMV